VYAVLSHLVKGVAGRDNVDHLPHVPLAEGHIGLLAILGDIDLLLAHMLQPGHDLLSPQQRSKPESSTNSERADLTQIVTNQIEPKLVCKMKVLIWLEILPCQKHLPHISLLLLLDHPQRLISVHQENFYPYDLSIISILYLFLHARKH
jgi:hypothetical protein